MRSGVKLRPPRVRGEAGVTGTAWLRPSRAKPIEKWLRRHGGCSARPGATGEVTAFAATLFSEQERPDAGRENHGTCATRQARRQVGVDSGGRVRARGDSPRARGEARRALARAGDRDRAIQSAARRGESAAAQARRGWNIAAYDRELGGKEACAESSVDTALDRDQAGAQTRGAVRRVAACPRQPRPFGSSPTVGGAALRSRQKGCAHQRVRWP